MHRTELEIRTAAPIELFELPGKNGATCVVMVDVLSMDESDKWLEKHVEKIEALRQAAKGVVLQSAQDAMQAHREFNKALIAAICAYSREPLKLNAAKLRKQINGEQAKVAYRRLFEISSPFFAMEQEEADQVTARMQAMGPEGMAKALEALPGFLKQQRSSQSHNGSPEKEASGQ